MLQRIAKLFFWAGWTLAPRPRNWLDELPCLKVIDRNRLRMRIFHNRMDCGHSGCIVSLLVHEDETWMETALLSGEDIQTAAGLLQEAMSFIEAIDECAPG